MKLLCWILPHKWLQPRMGNDGRAHGACERCGKRAAWAVSRAGGGIWAFVCKCCGSSNDHYRIRAKRIRGGKEWQCARCESWQPILDTYIQAGFDPDYRCGGGKQGTMR